MKEARHAAYPISPISSLVLGIRIYKSVVSEKNMFGIKYKENIIFNINIQEIY